MDPMQAAVAVAPATFNRKGEASAAAELAVEAARCDKYCQPSILHPLFFPSSALHLGFDSSRRHD